MRASGSTLRRALPWGGAVAWWLGLGFSLGWYYTFTYYGYAGWPMPLFEPMMALVLYYFSVLNVATEGQAVHWMLVFPLAGLVWAWALQWVARRRGLAQPAWPRLVWWLALSAAPLALPGPAMAWLAGQTEAGFDTARMLAVALRRGHVAPWDWLTPLYLTMGFLSLGLQLAVHRYLYRLPPLQAAIHYFTSAIVALLVASVSAAIAAWPLRWVFE